MSRRRGRHQQTSLLLGATLAAVVTALLIGSPAAATTRAVSASAGAENTKEWCDAVIQANTKAGAMKNKRFLPVGTISPSTWKKVVDVAVSGRSRFLAVTPSSIKTAVTHELDYFARIKAHNYSRTTPLGSWTVAEVGKITDFEKTKCGIKFS
jgi:hypothetical protein